MLTTLCLQYVVDGQWLTNPGEPTEADASGNVNNVLSGEPTSASASTTRTNL